MHNKTVKTGKLYSNRCFNTDKMYIIRDNTVQNNTINSTLLHKITGVIQILAYCILLYVTVLIVLI